MSDASSISCLRASGSSNGTGIPSTCLRVPSTWPVVRPARTRHSSTAERVLGLQFHLESTPGSVADIVRECAGEIVPAVHVQTAERMLAASPEDYAGINQALFGILDRLPQ